MLINHQYFANIRDKPGVAWLFQPTTPALQVVSYLMVEIFLLGFFVLYLLIFRPIFFPLDDAYITLHNALVLHWGYDPNYNGVSPLNGATSLVHLFIVYILLFKLQPLPALLVSQWIAIILYAVGLMRLAYTFQASLLQAFTILIIGLIYSTQIFQLLNGLETGLALAAMTWSLAILNSASTRFSRICLGILCGTMPFIRPELWLWSILVITYIVFRDKLFSNKPAVIELLAPTIIAALPWLLTYWVSLGTFFPATLRAKTAFYAELHWPFLAKYHVLWLIIKYYPLWTGWPSLIGMLILLLFAPIRWIGWLFFLGFMLCYGYYFPQSILFHSGRYLAIGLPILFYGLLAGLHSQQRYLRYFAYLVLILTIISSLQYFSQNWEIYRNSRALMLGEQTALAKWCQDNLEENALVLVHDAGYLSFATHLRLVDMVGLKSPANVQYHKQYTLPTRGKKRIEAVSKILKNSHAQYIIVIVDWNLAFGIIPGLESLGWSFKKMRFSDWGYEVYRVKITPKN